MTKPGDPTDLSADEMLYPNAEMVEGARIAVRLLAAEVDQLRAAIGGGDAEPDA